MLPVEDCLLPKTVFATVSFVDSDAALALVRRVVATVRFSSPFSLVVDRVRTARLYCRSQYNCFQLRQLSRRKMRCGVVFRLTDCMMCGV